MNLSEIELRTREAFGGPAIPVLELDPIKKGGSGRMFVRVSGVPAGRSLIAMHYTHERPDNPRFAAITDFLCRNGIPVPAIVERREDLNLLWVEDLGSIDLTALSESDWDEVRRPAYESALRNVFRLHRMSESFPPADLPDLEPPFDEKLYLWELDYFLNEYVARFLSPSLAEQLRTDDGVVALRRELLAEPRCLVHRDFQSSNVMVLGNETYLIDYQGMRWGLAEYDLASMIYDPYTNMADSQREALVDYYFSLVQADGAKTSRAQYRSRLTRCAIQRLMQALGAYGFLSEVKGKTEYLQHIPTARERLCVLARGMGGVPAIAEALGQ